VTAASRPLTVRQRLRAYGGVARVVARTLFIYRSNFIFGSFGLLMQVFLLHVVWTAVFPASGSATSGGHAVTLGTQIAYSTLATVQYNLFNPWEVSLIPERVRDGTIAVDLARPVSFTGQMLAGQLGFTLGSAPFALLAFPFAVLAGGAQAPASAGAGFGYAVSLVLGYLISVLLGGLMGMVAFWTLELQGMMLVYYVAGQFLSGALVPLWFMPGWLRGTAQWLPFQGTTYTPIAIYLGQSGGPRGALAAIGVQAAWVLVLSALLWAVWKRALRRVTVQGG
jgi:ABC-2 type transport system permease protein